MKKYSRKNWYTLFIACILGLSYGGYIIYSSQGGVSSVALIAFGILAVLVLVILLLVKRFF